MRLIEQNNLLKSLSNELNKLESNGASLVYTDPKRAAYNRFVIDGMREAINIVNIAPVIMARREAKWIEEVYEDFSDGYAIKTKYMCPACEGINYEPTNFCPNCGAMMRVGAKKR